MDVAVIGATGYAGAEMVRLLTVHPCVRLTMLTSRQYAGVAFSEVFPAFAGQVDTVCQAYDRQRICEAAQLVFTALPHKVSMALVPELIEAGACCVVACYQDYLGCIDECGGGWTCNLQCRPGYVECRDNC